jgi:uncharacterized protein YbjT (DUF2867 family)
VTSIGVLGGTGVAGSAVAEELRRRGHEVRVLGRRVDGPGRVDVESGAGLPDAVAGLDVLVDALNGRSPRPRDASAVLVAGLGRALAAAREAGVGHVVSLAIVGAERVPLGYYRVKVEQERVVRACGIPSTIVRATQFHGLIDDAFAATARAGVLLAPRGELQTVDPHEVAAVVVAAAEAAEPGGDQAIAGPEITPIAELARAWREHRGVRRPVLRLPAVGPLLRAVARGELVDPGARRGSVTFRAWLTAH